MDIEIWKCIQICILRKKGGSDVVLTFYQVGNLNPISLLKISHFYHLDFEMFPLTIIFIHENAI